MLPHDAQLSVAVLIAAYRAEAFIEECLRSVRAQVLPAGVTVDVRVGVDNCDATAEVVERLGQPYWRAHTNVGPYLIRNSLARIAPADAFAVFDADDVMEPWYLNATLALAGADGIGGAARFDGFGSNGAKLYQHGVCTFSAAAWFKLGGYADTRLAGDYDATERAKMLGVPLRTTKVPLYTRRRHEGSLVARFPMKSAERRAAVKALDADRRTGRAVVRPTFVPLRHNSPDPQDRQTWLVSAAR